MEITHPDYISEWPLKLPLKNLKIINILQKHKHLIAFSVLFYCFFLSSSIIWFRDNDGFFYKKKKNTQTSVVNTSWQPYTKPPLSSTIYGFKGAGGGRGGVGGGYSKLDFQLKLYRSAPGNILRARFLSHSLADFLNEYFPTISSIHMHKYVYICV